MRPTTVLWLALRGGRSDHLRISFTGAASAIAAFLVLAAANVVLIGDGVNRYHSPLLDQRGLHLGVVMSIAGLLVPLTLFVGQCSRIGAPERDRRLASLRMSGADPSDVIKVAATETGISATAGAAAGAALFALARWGYPSEPDINEIRSLPTDVGVAWWIYLAVVIAIGGLAIAGAGFALRSVTIDPLGVIRHKRIDPPAIAPFILLVVGSVGLAFSASVFRSIGIDQRGEIVPIAIVFTLFACVALGLIFGTAALAQWSAAKVAPQTRRPALLIASRRVLDNPFQASKPTAAVLLAVFAAAAIQQIRVTFLLATDSEDTFFVSTFDLLNLVLVAVILIAAAGLITATAEAIIQRRRTLASLVAAGTPRATLARSALIENFFALIPGTLIATATGALVARGFSGTRVTPYSSTLRISSVEPASVSVPIPWTELATLAAGTLVATTTIAALALIFIPSSTATTELRTAA